MRALFIRIENYVHARILVQFLDNQPENRCMVLTTVCGFDLVNICVSDDVDPVPRRQTNGIGKGHEDFWSC